MKAATVHSAHTGPVYALCTTSEGAILSAGGDGQVLRWHSSDVDRIQLVARIPAAVYSLYHHPTSNLLFAGTADGELFVLDTVRKSVVHRFSAHAKGIFAITALPNDRIVVAGGDGVLSTWQLTSELETRLSPLRRIPLCEDKLRGLACPPDSGQLAVACGDGTVRVLDTVLFNETATCTGHEGGANAVAFHPGKHVLVSGGKDGYVRAWDLAHGCRGVLALAAHRSTIYAVAFDPASGKCASASRDRTVKLWDPASFEPILRLDAKAHGHSHSVNALCWLNGDLFTSGDDRNVIRWTSNDK